jgi:hypothetical protein
VVLLLEGRHQVENVREKGRSEGVYGALLRQNTMHASSNAKHDRSGGEVVCRVVRGRGLEREELIVRPALKKSIRGIEVGVFERLRFRG